MQFQHQPMYTVSSKHPQGLTLCQPFQPFAMLGWDRIPADKKAKVKLVQLNYSKTSTILFKTISGQDGTGSKEQDNQNISFKERWDIKLPWALNIKQINHNIYLLSLTISAVNNKILIHITRCDSAEQRQGFTNTKIGSDIMTMIFITLIMPPNLEASHWHQVINYYPHTLTSTLTFENEDRKIWEKKLRWNTPKQRWDSATLPPAAKTRSFTEEESFSAWYSSILLHYFAPACNNLAPSFVKYKQMQCDNVISLV